MVCYIQIINNKNSIFKTFYFECNVISDELEQFLLDRDDALEYLYQEYMSDDTANIQNEIEGFVSNVIYKFKTIEK